MYKFQFFWPRGTENHFKNALFPPYHSEKSPWGKGAGWEPTFLHVALIKPSVEGKTGLDSWPFPTSTQLVHLKRPCDRNSMPQEIECSCFPVVCFSIMGLFFSLFASFLLFHTFFFLSGNEWEELRLFSRRRHDPDLKRRFSAFTVNPVMLSCIWLDGIINPALPPPPPSSLSTLSPLWDFLQNVFVSHYRENQEFHNHARALWKWMSASQSISGASVWSSQLQSVTNADDTFPRCPHYISTKPLEADLFMSALTSGIFSVCIYPSDIFFFCCCFFYWKQMMLGNATENYLAFLGSPKMCFVYWCFTWMFDLHYAEGRIWARLTSITQRHAGFCDIATCLEADGGPIYNVHKCNVKTLKPHTLRMNSLVKQQIFCVQWLNF